MYLEIITPDKQVFQGEVDSATFPGSNGAFQVLNNHAPLISALDSGKITYKNAKGTFHINVDGGVVEVLQNHIIVLAESAVTA